MDEYEELLDANPIWKRRTQGVGFISLEDMLDLGITGPMVRAAGVPMDVRKTEPYSSERCRRYIQGIRAHYQSEPLPQPPAVKPVAYVK